MFLLIPNKSYLSVVGLAPYCTSCWQLHLQALLLPTHLTMDVIRGELDIQIIAARNLPDTDNFLFSMFKKDLTDPFVTGYLGSTKILMTSVKDNTLEPRWDEQFHIQLCHKSDSLRFIVQDKDHAWSECIGEVSVSFYDISNGPVSGWFPIINHKGRQQGQLQLKVTFQDAASLMVKYYEKSLEDILMNQYKIDSYFEMRSGCHVDLYSCARNIPRPVQLSSGETYQPGSCFLDMYRAIIAAEKFIYITGWSVWTKLQMIRGEDVESLETDEERENCGLNLGELLKMKSESGVRVLILVWSDLSSTVTGEGMMGTHDQETKAYFAGSGVECCLVPREVAVGDLSDVVNTSVARSYTHHQKSIIADSKALDTDSRRTIVAFVGGLDITDGRYDTPDHPLFKTLCGVHQDDFYQGSAPGVLATEGPRQPWQDIHTKLTGPIAFDVCKNFMERWSKQGQNRSSLFNLKPHKFNLSAETGNWNVQLLRSITDDSAEFRDDTRMYTLTIKKSRMIEDSINRAYIHTIRAAERFIYVENQYFLGSAYAWETDQKVKCHHTIPAEIAEKIVEKIRADEDFFVFIVIPLHPEGDPATGPIQEILAWQRRTMAMMYRRIGNALIQKGSTAHPTEYLQFYCLVKKEEEEDIPEELDTPAPGKAATLRSSRRFMIYVHSKLLIADDSVAIVGSANINQRSMAGSRDSELAVLAHQPEHTLLSQGGKLPKGEVAQFRTRLMEEHLGHQDSTLTQPNSQECKSFVRDICKRNWEVGTENHRHEKLYRRSDALSGNF